MAINDSNLREDSFDNVKRKEITQDEIFAPIVTAIMDVSEAMQKLKDSRLTKRAVILLIHDQTGIPLRTIETIIESAAQLHKTYLKY